MVVLDLGAGRGAWFEDETNQYRKQVRTLRGKVKKLIAVDVDEAVLQNNSCDAKHLMDGDQIPLSDNSVDLIVSDYVLEHISDRDIFYKEIDRVLKIDGWFCARTPHKYNYISFLARIIKINQNYIIKKAQPNRKDVDIFPTFYTMNTLKDLNGVFHNYENKSFIFRSDPSYFFGSSFVYHILSFLHRVSPSVISGNLFVFLRKRAP